MRVILNKADSLIHVHRIRAGAILALAILRVQEPSHSLNVRVMRVRVKVLVDERPM